ncbi:MAG: hypothetical protein EXS08_15160 [Planctomycetes bacterium]|nr:hypothetical protein [Planctomycetota bacterium]
MRLRAVLASLPEGYELVRGRRGWLAVERASRPALEAAPFGPDGGEALLRSDLAGRRPLAAIQAPGERWIVRRFHHGGLFRALGERCFLTPARPFQELGLAAALRALGFATPRVVAARAVRDGLLGWRLALVSARVEGVHDGAAVLERLRAGELSIAQRKRFVETMGELVGRLHAARFLHADLHPRNVLFGADLAQAWILDLDRGRFVAELSALQRRDNLRRLFRAVRRRETRARAFLRRSDYRCFLAAYARTRGACGDWREDWRAIVRRDRLAAPLHRLGWGLEALFRSGPEVRDGAATPR